MSEAPPFTLSPTDDPKQCSNGECEASLLDELVGTSGGLRTRYAERLGGLMIVTSSYFIGACNREVCRLLAFQYTVDVDGSGPIRNETTCSLPPI